MAENELPRLDELERRGRDNGLAGIERLDARQLREHEPHAGGIAGLFVPETGIVDYVAVAESLAAEIRAAGGEVRTGAAVTAIRQVGGTIEVEAQGERFAASFLVGCAGLASDRLARLGGLDPQVRIIPFRGDYYELLPEARSLVRHLIYPVPDPDLPFLGVHFTRRVDGSIEAGPNAVLAWKREGYSRSSFSLRDTASMLAFPGFWRMAPHYAGIGFAEYRRAWSRGLFVRSLQRLVPEIGRAPRASGRLRCAGAGDGPLGQAPRRLRLRRGRPPAPRRQRPLARRHRLPGDRRLHRREGDRPSLRSPRDAPADLHRRRLHRPAVRRQSRRRLSARPRA